MASYLLFLFFAIYVTATETNPSEVQLPVQKNESISVITELIGCLFQVLLRLCSGSLQMVDSSGATAGPKRCH